MKKAVHIYLSHFENESRILKETKSLIDHRIVDQVVVLAMGKEGLLDFEEFDKNRFVKRVRPQFMRNKKPIRGFYRISQYIKMLDFLYRLVMAIRKEKPIYVNLHQVMLLPLIPVIKLLLPKAKLIYDAHELETETNGLKGRRKKMFKIWEKLFIKRFGLVIVVGPSIEQWYRERYGINNIITVMNCPLYQQVQKQNHFREEFGIAPESKIFLYQGALFYGRGIEVLLHAFAEINDPKYTLVCMGYGEMAEEVQKYATIHQNIFFKKAVHPSVVLNYTASADVGISLIENVCLSYYYCLPNKIFEYLMAEIPCIVSNMQEMRNYVLENGTGVVCEDTTKEALIKSVLEMGTYDTIQFKNNIESVKQKYCWASQEKEMIAGYNKFLPSSL